MNPEFQQENPPKRLPSNKDAEHSSDLSPVIGVIFSEEQKGKPYQNQGGTISRIIIKTGLAKNEKTAQVVMIIMIIVFFVASIMVLPKKSPEVRALPPVNTAK